MGQKTENARVDLYINTVGAEASIRNLQNDARKLKSELSLLSPTTDEFVSKSKKLSEVQTQLKNVEESVKEVDLAQKLAVGSLEALQFEYNQLQKELKLLSPATDDFVNKSKRLGLVEKEISDVNTKLKELSSQEKIAAGSIVDLTRKADLLGKELRQMSQSDPAFQSKLKDFQKLTSELETQNLKLQGTTKFWKEWGNSIKDGIMIPLGMIGFQAIFTGIDNLMQRNAKLSDQFADIRKTTGLSAEGVNELNASFSKLDTRTSTNDLREMAIVAGQLGISGKENIIAFTASMDKLNVALGDEFGSTEEITKQMGGLRNIFTDIKSEKVDDDLLSIGNAINELSASGAATAPVVADFSNRIGGVGISLGLSSGQVLGMSAALQEMNVSAERGGTAITNIMQKMTRNTAEFAKIAGMDVNKFANLLNNDLYGAFLKVVEGSQKFKGNAVAMGGSLKELELSGGGVSEVFAKLGGNLELLQDKVNLASNSLKNQNSIMNEFEIKNSNFAANLEKIQKAIAGVFINPTVIAAMEKIVEVMAKMVEGAKDYSDGTKDELKSLQALQVQFNKRLETIITSNVNEERRRQLMLQLNQDYKDYFKIQEDEIHNMVRINELKEFANARFQDAIDLKNKESQGIEAYNKLTTLQLENQKDEYTLAKKRLELKEQEGKLTVFQSFFMKGEINDLARKIELRNKEIEQIGRLNIANAKYSELIFAKPTQKDEKENSTTEFNLGLTDEQKAKQKTALDDWNKMLLEMAKKHNKAMLDNMNDGFGKEATVLTYRYEEMEAQRKLNYFNELDKQKKLHSDGLLTNMEFNARKLTLDKIFGEQRIDIENNAQLAYQKLVEKYRVKDAQEYRAYKDSLQKIDIETEQKAYDRQVKLLTNKANKAGKKGNFDEEAATKEILAEMALSKRLEQIERDRTRFAETEMNKVNDTVFDTDSDKVRAKERANQLILANNKKLNEEIINAETDTALALRDIDNERLQKKLQQSTQIAGQIAQETFSILSNATQSANDAAITQLQSRHEKELQMMQAQIEAEKAMQAQKYADIDKKASDSRNKEITDAQKAVYKNVQISRLSAQQKLQLDNRYAADKQAIDAKFENEQRKREAQRQAEEAQQKQVQAAQESMLKNKQAQEERQLKLKAFNETKSLQLAQAISNGALAITNILANTIDPIGVYKAVLIGIATATTLAQIATISSSQPGFKDGTEFVDGPEGVDVINARLTKGERVVPVQYNQALTGIPNEALPQMANIYRAQMQYSPNTSAITQIPRFVNGAEMVGQGSYSSNSTVQNVSNSNFNFSNQDVINKLDEVLKAIQTQEVILDYAKFQNFKRNIELRQLNSKK